MKKKKKIAKEKKITTFIFAALDYHFNSLKQLTAKAAPGERREPLIKNSIPARIISSASINIKCRQKKCVRTVRAKNAKTFPFQSSM